jgi:hypothetical protein
VRSPTTYRLQHRRDAPGGTRTPDQQLRRLPLYPSELLAPALPLVPLAGSRTWILYGSATSDTSYHEIGAAGFEPATSCSQSRRDTGLRYAPQISGRVCYPAGAPRSTGTRKSVAISCAHHTREPPLQGTPSRGLRQLRRALETHTRCVELLKPRAYGFKAQQRGKRATAMTDGRLRLACHLGERRAEVV